MRNFIDIVPYPSDMATQNSRFARAAIRFARNGWFNPDPFNPDFPERTSDPDDDNFYVWSEKWLTPIEIAQANARGAEILQSIRTRHGSSLGVKEFMDALDVEVAKWMKDPAFPRDPPIPWEDCPDWPTPLSN